MSWMDRRRNASSSSSCATRSFSSWAFTFKMWQLGLGRMLHWENAIWAHDMLISPPTTSSPMLTCVALHLQELYALNCTVPEKRHQGIACWLQTHWEPRGHYWPRCSATPGCPDMMGIESHLLFHQDECSFWKLGIWGTGPLYFPSESVLKILLFSTETSLQRPLTGLWSILMWKAQVSLLADVKESLI